ncbi:MAG: glutathione S-transferase N-terminal domain-containing protein [Pseudomonadota bacterium]|nr:glutathione S-transferase N-terminal domain-containing protein [Pseudomonadota bacterium]
MDFDAPFRHRLRRGRYAQENSRAEILRFSPAGKCPSLHDGEIVVWDSLAIIEYLAELYPGMSLAGTASGMGAGAFARRRNALKLYGLARTVADEHAPQGQETRADPRGKRRCRPPRTGFWASPQGVRSSWRLYSSAIFRWPTRVRAGGQSSACV